MTKFKAVKVPVPQTKLSKFIGALMGAIHQSRPVGYTPPPLPMVKTGNREKARRIRQMIAQQENEK